jgi:hypothetical protein
LEEKFMKFIDKSKTYAKLVRYVFNGALMAAALSIAALVIASCGGAESENLIGPGNPDGGGGGGGAIIL